MAAEPRILIIGAGPCGIACGRELLRLGHRNWLILERAGHPGGLASSVVDREGFTWDLGGHVVFSHFGEFDALLKETMGEETLRHERSSYVRYGDRWVPYPFQNNLRHLPGDVVEECLSGLARARGGHPGMDFANWMRAVFGDGITRHFMEPYNFKVWATPAEEMASTWIAERVAVIDYERALKNVREASDDLAWGPNNMFVFPEVGGTGEIYSRAAARLGDHIQYNREVVGVDWRSRRVRLRDGGEERYDRLVSTAPVDQLIAAVDECPPPVREAASQLRHNGVYMVGVGYEQPLVDDKSWMYFPQDHAPFYRATNFAKYSPANVPGGEVNRYCSYMTESSYSDCKVLPREGLEERVETGLRDAGVVAGRPAIASIHVEDIAYAYPVPTYGRDRALGVDSAVADGAGHLLAREIRLVALRDREYGSRGKDGTDIARRLVLGVPEELHPGTDREALPAWRDHARQ